MSTPGILGYLDCSTGVSGDKFLGALLDAGSVGEVFTEHHLQGVLDQLAPEARITVKRVISRGVSALSVSVDATDQPTHRSWSDIRGLIGRSDLPEQVRASSLRAFELLAHAEAGVHGTLVDDIHFHEVGALDSILDVVGVCSGVHALGIETLSASAVATGWGTVDASHGVLPVPAPATAALLLGIPVTPGPPRPDGSSPGELTTPTGAALLKALATSVGPCPPLTARLIGYGAGTRDIGNPNVCRLTVGEPAAEIDLDLHSVSVLESNVDHLSPEIVAMTAEQLLVEGALDVWTSPITMKKGRLAVTLSVLVGADPDIDTAARHFAQRVVALTGSLGIRRTDLQRYEASRESISARTSYGDVRFKIGPPGASPRVRPEADDVVRIAREHALPFRVIDQVLSEWAANSLDKNEQR